MEPQAHDIIGEAVEKLTKVRDAVSITDTEQAIVIDVVASLRTLRAMYTEHQEPEIEKHGFKFSDISKVITGDK